MVKHTTTGRHSRRGNNDARRGAVNGLGLFWRREGFQGSRVEHVGGAEVIPDFWADLPVVVIDGVALDLKGSDRHR